MIRALFASASRWLSNWQALDRWVEHNLRHRPTLDSAYRPCAYSSEGGAATAVLATELNVPGNCCGGRITEIVSDVNISMQCRYGTERLVMVTYIRGSTVTTTKGASTGGTLVGPLVIVRVTAAGTHSKRIANSANYGRTC